MSVNVHQLPNRTPRMRRRPLVYSSSAFPQAFPAMLLQSDFNLRHGDALRQLSAARVRFSPIALPMRLILAIQLWAFMLRNSSKFFVHQCAKREFLETLEDVLSSQRTSPIVRENLLDVLAAAAYASSRTSHKRESGFALLLGKFKPAGKPGEVGL
jgi:hypothetical protein